MMLDVKRKRRPEQTPQINGMRYYNYSTAGADLSRKRIQDEPDQRFQAASGKEVAVKAHHNFPSTQQCPWCLHTWRLATEARYEAVITFWVLTVSSGRWCGTFTATSFPFNTPPNTVPSLPEPITFFRSISMDSGSRTCEEMPRDCAAMAAAAALSGSSCPAADAMRGTLQSGQRPSRTHFKPPAWETVRLQHGRTTGWRGPDVIRGR